MSERDAASEGRPSGLEVVLAPWLGILHPAAAARTLVSAAGMWFWTVYAGHVLLLAALGVLLVMADATIQRSRSTAPMALTSAPASNPVVPRYSVQAVSTLEIRTRTLAELWRDWHADGPFGPAEAFFVLFATITAGGTALLAWLNLPRVHRNGPVAPAFDRAFRCVACAGGLLLILTFAVGACVVWAGFADRVLSGSLPHALAVLAPMSVAGGTILILHRVGRGISALGENLVALSLSRRCQGCGYDLAHQPSDALCPECGYRVADSLDPDRRPGVEWERSNNREWITSAVTILVRPRLFYAALRLRTPPGPAASFATRIYVFIGFGAGLWIALMAMGTGGDLLFAPIFALSAPLICWFGHRLGGATVISWWIYRRALPDTRWAAKVLAYEAAYLWVFCGFWGVLATSFIYFGQWVSNAAGDSFFYPVFGVHGEVVVLFGGTALLALVWLWRYSIALQAIRWSNY